MILLRAWLVFCGFWCSAVWSADLAVDRSWVEDPHANMTLAQVQAAPASPLQGLYWGKGFSKSVLWLRLHIDPGKVPGAVASDRWVVRIRPVYLDEVQLHDPLRGDAPPQFTGDQYPWFGDDYKSLNLNFSIPVGDAPRDIWLRMQTSSSTLSSVEVLREAEAKAQDLKQAVIAIFLLAVLLVCMAWGVWAWLMFRDALILRYIVREVVALAYVMTMLGGLRVIGAHWLDAEQIDKLANAMFCVYGLTLVWFESHLLALFDPPALLLRLLRWNRWPFLMAIVLVVLGHDHEAVVLNSISTMFAISLGCITALFARAWRHPVMDERPVVSRWMVSSIYGLLTLLVMFNRLPATGLLPGYVSVFYLLLVYPIVSSILMMSILQIRAYRLHKRQSEVGLRLQFAEKAMNDERQRRLEQERFLSMLSHELKTPVSVARISLDAMKVQSQDSDRIARALQNINDVVDRCQVSDAMENQRLTVRRQEFELRDLLFERIDLLVTPHRVKVFEGKEVWLCSDSHLVGIVLSNLLDNALKYSPEESVVEVSVHAQTVQGQTGVCMALVNQVGLAGVPDKAQIFQKYYRAKAAESQSGSGLGLYLSAGLATMLGGTLQHQVAGDKVEFRFCLPV